ncbi:MAG: IclR family transcriptional regulator [Desulfobacterales bacterium]|nr:IclR family transcriptional regulator [Desulfobacterales bacterium]
MKKKSEGRIIQSVERSINALLLFLEDYQELGIKDFSRMLGLPKPTIYSLVNTMTKHQLLEQNPENSKYRLGPVLLRLGLQYARQSDVLSTVSVWTERLCYKFGKSVNVCMLVGGQVVVVYKADPDQVVISYPDVGAVVPIHNTANGKILMAYADPEERDGILEDYSFIKSTEFTISDKDAFYRELEQVREEGISFNRQEGVSGIIAISGPIFNHRGQVIASFAISGKVGYFEENEGRLVGEVKKTAQAMSRQLGYTGRIYL